jgi:hypothetical protein
MPILGSFGAGSKGGYGRGGNFPYSVDFLVIAGGASSGHAGTGGGGGAGGYRSSYTQLKVLVVVDLAETALVLTLSELLIQLQ